jgi:TRAP transporter TAXI family solute receptor
MILTPIALLICAAVAIPLLLIRSAPPTELVMSTGAADGTYHAVAMKYRDILARDGVRLTLRPSAGAAENLRRLTDPESGVDVALVQGGVVSMLPPEKTQHLVSLGSMYYEPMWMFYRADHEIDHLMPFGGKMIAVGAEGSGTAALAMQMLETTGIADPPTTVMKIGGRAAANLLLAGNIDLAFFMADANAPVIQELTQAEGVRLMNPARADAYVRRHFYLTKLSVPMGVFDMKRNIPAREIALVATTANLVVKDDLHPALAFLLLRAASEVHAAPTLFSGLRQFPAPNDTELPLSAEAGRFYRSGPPFLQRYLPYWAANLVDRLLRLLIPAVAVLFPAFKLLPPLYRWRIRRRIYRWYARLKEIELELGLEPGRTPEQLADLQKRLDAIEEAVNRIPTPLAYSNNLYEFRHHIDLVRQRAQGRAIRPHTPPKVVAAP